MKIARLLNTENKHVDIQNSNTVLPSASLILCCTPPAEGSDSNQRTGRSLKVDKIDLLLQFTYSTGTPATCAVQSQIFNWYLVRYLKTPSSGGTTVFNITEFLNQDANSQYTPMSLINDDTDENFQVMAAGTQHLTLPFLPTVASAFNAIQTHTHQCSFHQTFNGTTAATITDNCVFLVVTAMNASNTGGISNCTSTMRMWFVDN
jgi:hypothetical protein